MKAIQLTRSIPRYLLTRSIGQLYRPVYWSPLALLKYHDVPEPRLPGPEWVKISTTYGGICGSDMNALLLNDSLALSTMVSFPFTLGHENSGVIAENLEILKRSGKPTYVYEYYTKKMQSKSGWLDPQRVYDPYYNWKEYMRKKKRNVSSVRREA